VSEKRSIYRADEQAQPIPEMTSASSVGVGLVSPLGMAADYAKRHGTKSSLQAFIDYMKAMKVKRQVAEEVQNILINKYGSYGLAGNLIALDEGVAPEYKVLKMIFRILRAYGKKPIDIKLKPHDPNKTHRTGARVYLDDEEEHEDKGSKKTGGVKEPKVKAPTSKPKKTKSEAPKPHKSYATHRRTYRTRKGSGVKIQHPKGKRRLRIHEGLGYSDDADGRGHGPTGGSPYGADGQAPVRDKGKCPRCGSPSYQEQMDGSKSCGRCSTTYGLPYLSGQTANTGTFGNVRLPGGSVETNEVRVTCLDTNLYEISVNGTTSMHSRPVLPEALAHVVSPFGITYRVNMSQVLEWLWHKAKPGDTLVFDRKGNPKYVVGGGSFKYNMES
jgi:ribosomal protein S27AE